MESRHMSSNKYHTFLSYSHKDDRKFARALQSTLQRFGSAIPWKRRMRVFRDDTNLDANPDLWGSIERGLDNSSHLLLLASPESAVSTWVDKEVRHFVSSKGPSKLSILLTDGTTRWTDPDRSPDAPRSPG